MLINSNPVQNTQPAFGHRLPKGIFNDVRKIPNMRCIICDEVMLTLDQMDNYLKGFGLGSAQCLKDKRFDTYKEMPVYKKLKEISKKHPKTSLLILLEKNKQSLGISDKLYNKIYKIADELVVPAPVAIKKINKYYNILSNEKKQIVDVMRDYAKKYPKITFSEIFKKEEVYCYHFEQNNLLSQKLNKEKKLINKKIFTLCEQLPSEEQKKVKHAINYINNKILKFMSQSEKVTNYNITNAFSKLLKTSSDKETIQNIIDCCISYPKKQRNVHTFVISSVNDNLKDKDMFRIIFNDVRSSFEHIKLNSQAGTRDKSNGLYDHYHCNQEGGNLPMQVRIENDNTLINRIRIQCNKILTLIRTGHLQGYNDFPNIQKTFDIQTPHLIKIDIKRFYNEQIKLKRQEIKELEKRIIDIDKDYQDVLFELSQLKQSQHNNNKKSFILKRRKNNLNNIKLSLNNKISIINKEIRNLKALNKNA